MHPKDFNPNYLCPLFLPGTKLDKLDKALACGPSSIVIDLEDAVAIEEKEKAIEQTIELLKSLHPCDTNFIIRICNPMSDQPAESNQGLHQCEMLKEFSSHPAAANLPIMVPKATVRSLGIVQELLPSYTLFALIETAAGLFEIEKPEFAVLSKAWFFGAADLSGSVGCASSREALLFARSKIIATAAVRNRPVIDSPCFELNNLEVVIDDAHYAKELGFDGKLSIHPKHITSILNGFSPTPDEIELAKNNIAAGFGVSNVQGKMVDEPLRAIAERTLKRKEAIDALMQTSKLAS